jgi:hypothetical protein
VGTTPQDPDRSRAVTAALLRAHLSAASRYRHLTPQCPVCHRLLRLVMERVPDEPGDAEEAPASK